MNDTWWRDGVDGGSWQAAISTTAPGNRQSLAKTAPYQDVTQGRRSLL